MGMSQALSRISKTPCIDGAQFSLAAFAMRAGRVVDAPGQSNTDTHQGVDRSLDAPSTGTGMAEASRNGRWQPRYDFASRRTGRLTRSRPAFASGESGNFRFDAGTRRAKRAGRVTEPAPDRH